MRTKTFVNNLSISALTDSFHSGMMFPVNQPRELIMIRLILALLLAAGVVSVAHARQCNTTCNTYGGQTTCTTQCW